MADAPTTTSDAVLAVDIGATFIKFCSVDHAGHLLDEVTRLRTPYPCLPVALTEVVATIINESGRSRAGVGFPGEMTQGRVLEPGNLSRAGGISTPIDQRIHAKWLDFDFESALRARCRAHVRVVNDATLAAHGYAQGVGRELVFTLGTGLGISLVVDGKWQKIRDVGAEAFHDEGSYDEVFGDPARARDVVTWRRHFADAVAEFIDEFRADVVHVGGGNARFARPEDVRDVGCPVVFNDNEGTLRGAARLFDDQ